MTTALPEFNNHDVRFRTEHSQPVRTSVSMALLSFLSEVTPVCMSKGILICFKASS